MIAATLSLAGCTKESFNSNSGKSGKAIQFGASAKYSTLLTKTLYSGDIINLSDGQQKERIDWVPGYDVIRIWCENASNTQKYGDYKIESIENSNEISKATVRAGADSLQWSESATSYDFYSVYPSPSLAELGVVTINKNVVTAEIPSTQDQSTESYNEKDQLSRKNMRYAYMVAAKNVTDWNLEKPVTLEFNPIITTFEVSITNANDADNTDMTVSAVRLVSGSYNSDNKTYESYTTFLSGEIQATLSTSGDHTLKCTGSNYYVSTDFKGETKTIKPGETLKVTLFALPQDISNLNVEVVTGKGKKVMPLKQNKNYITFAKCHKHSIVCTQVNYSKWTTTVPTETKVLLYNTWKHFGTDTGYSLSWDGNIYYNGVALSDEQIIAECAKLTEVNTSELTEVSYSYFVKNLSYDALHYFSNATSMNLYGLSSMGVGTLDVQYMDKLTSLTYNGNVGAARISNCKNLDKIDFTTGSDCRELEIDYLPTLDEVDVYASTGLEHLTIHDCDELDVLELDDIYKIKKITLVNFPKLETIHLVNCASLTSLIVSKCPILTETKLTGSTQALTDITFISCPLIESFSQISNSVNLNVNITVEDCAKLTKWYYGESVGSLTEVKIK